MRRQSSSESIDIETLRARVERERGEQDRSLEAAVEHVRQTRGFARFLSTEAVAAYEEALAAGPPAPREPKAAAETMPPLTGFVTRG